MPAPCPLESPAYYTTILHTIALISAPINILGLYLILYKSPGITKYKYCVFYIQMAAFLTETHQSVVSPGYYFFPMLAGYNPVALLPASLNRTHVTMTLWLFYYASELPAVVLCFIYRHNAAEAMSRNGQKSRTMKKVSFAVSQIFPFAVGLTFYNSNITREQAFAYLSNNYPQCLFWLDHPTFQLYDWRTNYWVAVAGLGACGTVVVFATYAFSLGFRTMALLHELRSHMSPQTFRMHRSALIALSLQVLLPSVLLILPLLFCLWVIALDRVDHQQMATNSTIFICCHSLCATLAMIVANPRYRNIVRGYFGGLKIQRPVIIEPSSGRIRSRIN